MTRKGSAEECEVNELRALVNESRRFLLLEDMIGLFYFYAVDVLRFGSF